MRDIRLQLIWVIIFVFVIGLYQIVYAYIPKVGDSLTFRLGSYELTTEIFEYNEKVAGYDVFLLKSSPDIYDGGNYHANVPGLGLCLVGRDTHDAFTGEYLGIDILHPIMPHFGTIQYGDPVGTVKEWVGYSQNEDETIWDVEVLHKDIWEVMAYETVATSFGKFTNAMKVKNSSYHSWGVEYINGGFVPTGGWELYNQTDEWFVPSVGVIKIDSWDLVNCKIHGKIDFNPGGPGSSNFTGNTCVSVKVSAASRLCSAYMNCYAKLIKNPDVDISGEFIKAEKKYESTWEKAETKAAAKGDDCNTASVTANQHVIVSALEEIYNQIVAGLDDLGNKNTLKLGQTLLKASGKLGSGLLKTESANIKKPSPSKLKTTTLKAQEKFISSWNKSITTALRKGVTYSGPSEIDVETAIGALVAAVLDGMQ